MKQQLDVPLTQHQTSFPNNVDWILGSASPFSLLHYSSTLLSPANVKPVSLSSDNSCHRPLVHCPLSTCPPVHSRSSQSNSAIYWSSQRLSETASFQTRRLSQPGTRPSPELPQEHFFNKPRWEYASHQRHPSPYDTYQNSVYHCTFRVT